MKQLKFSHCFINKINNYKRIKTINKNSYKHSLKKLFNNLKFITINS